MSNTPTNLAMDIQSLRTAYLAGKTTPRQVIKHCVDLILADGASNAWISTLNAQQLEVYFHNLDHMKIEECPLWGIPFAIKDNIDLKELPTTAACPEFSYEPSENAFVVQQLINAGAIPLGKTNLDQFATGLVGTRSPYGAVHNAFNSDYISGGSSAGSAYAVAKGQVCFALGTDTAGSGRVPAAFNNIVGTKPSRGLLSCTGVVPACRSLDCVTFFSLTPQDAQTLLKISAVYDEKDSYARSPGQLGQSHLTKGLAGSPLNIGVPKKEQLEFFGHAEFPQLFQQACEQLREAGANLVEIDLAPFLDAATLLYQGPWIAERYHAVGKFISAHRADAHEVVANIILGGAAPTAVQAFDGLYKLQSLKQHADRVLQQVDCIVTPTVGQHYTQQAVEADPVMLNSHLGYYTNFMNLLDYSAIAIPAGFTTATLPFGITLFGPAFHDTKLNNIAQQYLAVKSWGMGATGKPMPHIGNTSTCIDYHPEGYIPVAVCGAHLSGMALNFQLLERQAKLLEATKTAPHYLFYALAGGPPFRPGIKRSVKQGEAIDIEVWAVPQEHFGSFVAGIPAPLGIGKVELINGQWVPGFICEPYGTDDAEDITELRGWRIYMETKAK